LVNTVVKHYVETHSDITFAKLKEKFPDKLALANYGVFTSVENAGKYAEKTYRMQPEDLVYLPKGNITICTCNYWRETQISEFIENAKKIGLEIKVE